MHGSCIIYYENGNKKSEYYYTDGNFRGPPKEYYPNSGRLNIECEIYHEESTDNVGKKRPYIDGYFHKYYENGNICSIRYYKNGLLHGFCHEYYENGNIQSTRYFQNNVQERSYISYHENGAIHGSSKLYYDDGQLKEDYNYTNGKLVKSYTSFDRNTKIKKKVYLLSCFGISFSFIMLRKIQDKDCSSLC